MGFSFRILRIISCKMVISVRVFQRGILAGVPECAPCPHRPAGHRGFCAGQAKAQPWAIIGPAWCPQSCGVSAQACLWGAGAGGSWDVNSSISSAHLLRVPCLVPGAVQGPRRQEAHIWDCPSPAPELRGQKLGLGLYNRGPTCLASRTLCPTSTASMQQPPALVLILKCPGLNVKG